MTYAPNETLDGWLAERRPSLLYPDGQEIRVGDQVDFGLDPRSIGIDPVEGPWQGTVLRVNVAAGRVLVDTFCNSDETYSAGDLKLLSRSDLTDDNDRFEVRGPWPFAGGEQWAVEDLLIHRPVSRWSSRGQADADRDRRNSAAKEASS